MTEKWIAINLYVGDYKYVRALCKILDRRHLGKRKRQFFKEISMRDFHPGVSRNLHKKYLQSNLNWRRSVCVWNQQGRPRPMCSLVTRDNKIKKIQTYRIIDARSLKSEKKQWNGSKKKKGDCSKRGLRRKLRMESTRKITERLKKRGLHVRK